MLNNRLGSRMKYVSESTYVTPHSVYLERGERRIFGSVIEVERSEPTSDCVAVDRPDTDRQPLELCWPIRYNMHLADTFGAVKRCRVAIENCAVSAA